MRSPGGSLGLVYHIWDDLLLQSPLMQGLLVCARCGYAYHGCTNDERNAYYRCSGSMSLPRFGGQRWCWNKELCLDQTDAAVWQEYRQRLQPQQRPNEHEGLEAQTGKLRRGIVRLIDSYAEELIDKREFELRVTRTRERMQHLEEQLQHLKEEPEVEEELRLILGHLETFAAKVKDGLQRADFQTRREIIRALVKRVEVDEQQREPKPSRRLHTPVHAMKPR